MAFLLLLATPTTNGIAAANNPPSVLLGADPSASGHGGPVVLPAWATLGPGANETNQTLRTSVDVDQPGLFDVPPAIDLAGNLTFTPHPGAAGLAHANLTVQDDGPVDGTTVAAFTITVTDLDPTAGVSLPVGLIPHAEGQFSDASTDDGRLVQWAWDFGDGATSTSANPAHSYAESGDYPVTLDILDDAGHAAHAAGLVTVAPAALQAAFALPRRVPLGVPFALQDGSTGGEGPLDSAWEFGDGATASTGLATHTWTSAGPVTVTLRSSDGHGATSSVTHTTTVYQAASANQPISGTPVAIATPAAGLVFNPSGVNGAVDMALSVSDRLAGLADDAVTTLDQPGRRGLLYVEGLPGSEHTAGAVANVDVTFHYAGLTSNPGLLQVWYWTGTAWVLVPSSLPTPLLVPASGPEGNETFYSWTIDPVASTLTVRALHASVFGLATVVGGGGGGVVLPPATPAPTPPATPAPTPPSLPAPGPSTAPTPASGPLAAVGAAIGGANGPADANETTVSLQARFRELLHKARPAASAAAVSVAILATGSAVAAAGSSILAALEEAAGETGNSMAEERFNESRFSRWLNKARRLKPGPITATLVALALVTVMFATAATGSLLSMANGLLSAGLPTLAVFGCGYGLDLLIARASGVAARLRLVGAGALALLVSTLGFRTPYGNPGAVQDEEDEGGEGRTDEGSSRAAKGPSEAARAWASLFGYLAFAVPVWVAGRWLGADFATVGYDAIVTMLVTASVPIAPLVGSALWHQRKSGALATWSACLALYVGRSVGLIPDAAIVLAGAAALPVFAALLVSFVVTRAPVPMAWVVAASGWFEDIAWVLVHSIPSPLRSAAGALGRAWDRMQAAASRGLRRALAPMLRHHATA